MTLCHILPTAEERGKYMWLWKLLDDYHFLSFQANLAIFMTFCHILPTAEERGKYMWLWKLLDDYHFLLTKQT